ncbi:mannose-specific lectin-like [Colossoma macropomum]|uniref:mannose-specific lectin-like n=1 Tax=Colossoma macropomum TaxID=42526 RepID=UPI001864F917|nr:mannose-specific lectin-like [Colossoma macropomum]
MSRNALFTNQELHKGDFLLSNDRNYKAIFQDDGNFVVYGWKPVWASDTWNKPGTRLIMQEDGNLVIYTCDGQPLWASNSCQNSITHDNSLFINNDGSLAVQRGSRVLWTTRKK